MEQRFFGRRSPENYGGEMGSTGVEEAGEASPGPWPGKNMERL